MYTSKKASLYGRQTCNHGAVYIGMQSYYKYNLLKLVVATKFTHLYVILN